MSVTQEALEITAALCRTFEGLYLKPYLCPALVPTIGIGSTLYEDGTKVTLQDAPITAERAEAILKLTLARDYLPGVVKASPGLLKSASRLGAIVDFAYNCGVPRYRASTLRKRVDSEDWPGARFEIKKWCRGGGKELRGLKLRRTAEAALI
jgi:lysozyme